MAKDKKSIIVYADWQEQFDSLTDEEAGKLIKHFFAYVNDENPTSDRLTELMFIPIKKALKRDLRKYESYIDKQKSNGKKGGRPKTQKTQAFLEKPKKADNVNDSVNVNDNDNVSNKVMPLLSTNNYKAMPLLSLSSKEFEDDTYLKTAQGFYSLFEKNLLDQGAKTTNLKKAKGTWVDDIRLIIEADEYDLEDLRLVFNFLQKDDFWKKQILSTFKLRKQMEKLIIQAKNPKNEKDKRNFTREQFEHSIDKHFTN